ncbi:reverse transcriptase-like protein [Candidatus Bathyarchaeota archaeon]|nr:MAG: reverse transcriptase-like protein [Candidatus Bathyarchaeota archaeon]
MPVYYIDGQSQGNEQNSLPRKAKIAIAYAESDTVDHGKFRIYWQPIGDRTNNEAEYYALLKALELIAEKATGKGPGKIGEALVRSDSTLVVNQVNGEWRVEDEKLIELSSNARNLIKKIGPARLEWVPREENLAGLWLEGKLKPFSVERLRE